MFGLMRVKSNNKEIEKLLSNNFSQTISIDIQNDMIKERNKKIVDLDQRLNDAVKRCELLTEQLKSVGVVRDPLTGRFTRR